jgi:hypothetical protein
MHGGDTFYMYLMLKFIYREGAKSNELIFFQIHSLSFDKEIDFNFLSTYVIFFSLFFSWL